MVYDLNSDGAVKLRGRHLKEDAFRTMDEIEKSIILNAERSALQDMDLDDFNESWTSTANQRDRLLVNGRQDIAVAVGLGMATYKLQRESLKIAAATNRALWLVAAGVVAVAVKLWFF